MHRPSRSTLPRLVAVAALAVPAGLAGAEGHAAQAVQAAASHSSSPHRVSPAAVRAAGSLLAGLALRFEPNAGQAPTAVRYMARGPRYGIYLTSTSAMLTLSRSTAAAQRLHTASSTTPAR